jgi:DNA polymerase III delta subunit
MEIIKEDTFRKQLKKGLDGAYLFFGDEDYLKSFSLKSARGLICDDPSFAIFNDIQIDPLDYTPNTLVNALMPLPMMSEKKIVSINGLAISSIKGAEFEELIEAISAIKEYDYNVLIISVPAGLIDEGNLPKIPSKTLLALSEVMTPVHFDAITGARLVTWVGKHFEHNGVSATAEVCEQLIEKCGKSMFTLSNETEKLAYYALQNNRNTVTLDDVERVACSVLTSDAYALANAILDGRYADAIDALNVMKFRRIDPIFVMPEVSRVICDLFTIKALQEEGHSVTEIARILKPMKMNEYKVRLYAGVTAVKSRESFERALLLCSEADLSLKLSPQGYSAIEKLICTL